ncbi:MAG: hypothetical protein Tsb0020_51250 [Haliangiales bacterium]
MAADGATERDADDHVAEVRVETFGGSHIGCVRESNQDGFLIGDLDRAETLQIGGSVDSAAASEVYEGLGDGVGGDGASSASAQSEVPRAAETDPDGARGDAGRGSGGAVIARAPGARGLVWVVCDGMGGAAAGEVASALAAQIVWDEMCRAQATTERVVYARLLRRAVRSANLQVWEQSRRHAHLRGMGTTLSAAGLIGNALILAQIGDSRAYVAREDQLVQVTHDQSVGAALVSAGRMTAEEVQATPHAHTVLQALGIHRDLEVALSIVRIRRGDRVLLCSDGLYGPLGDDGIRETLAAHDDLGDGVAALIEAACDAGGPDNVTAVLIRFDGDGLRPANPGERPRFVELDPMEEGERALVSTAKVARRLAAQFGLDEDPGPPVVPATGQHRARRVTPGLQELLNAAHKPPPAPAPDDDAAPSRSRPKMSTVGLAILALLVVIALIGWLYR